MVDITEKNNDLKPIDWQNGDVAMSKTHFYMIYNDPKNGITVHWHNKVTNEADKRHNFKSADDAKTWIKDVHYHAMRARYSEITRKIGLEIGQRWAHKWQPQVIIEIVMMAENTIYIKSYTETQTSPSYAIDDEPLMLKQFLSSDYCLMLDGETIEQALARCEAADILKAKNLLNKLKGE